MGHEQVDSRIPNRLQKRQFSALTSQHSRQMEPLRTVNASKEGVRAVDAPLVKEVSPWNTYELLYRMHLGDNDPVFVAQRKAISFGIFDIRHFPMIEDGQINMLKSIQHDNFVTAHELYRTPDGCYVVFDHMVRSLQEAMGNPLLDSQRLAAIIGQVVQAIAYLEERGLQHDCLTCSHILLHPSGRVKLCGQENCRPSTSRGNLRQLGYVMVELMEGYVEEGANIGLNDPEHWSPDVVDFLSATTSASSANELLKHPLLRSVRRDRLRGLVALVLAWTRPDYEYLGSQTTP